MAADINRHRRGHRAVGVRPALRSAAFTLLEVVIALAVLAVVLVSVFRLQAQDLSITEAITFKTIAPLLAQAKIGELDAAAADEMQSAAGDFGGDFPGYRWRLEVGDVTADWLGETAWRLKTVDLYIDLNQDAHVYHLRTQRMLAP